MLAAMAARIMQLVYPPAPGRPYVQINACGTALHAGMVARYLIVDSRTAMELVRRASCVPDWSAYAVVGNSKARVADRDN